LNVFFGHVLHVLSHGADEPVTHEHAQKRSDQGGADAVSQNLGRLRDLSHGQDDAQNGGDDPQSRERIGNETDALCRL